MRKKTERTLTILHRLDALKVDETAEFFKADSHFKTMQNLLSSIRKVSAYSEHSFTFASQTSGKPSIIVKRTN